MFAGRGSNEIMSCLLKYFHEHCRPQPKHLIVYSDNCSGQNKNSHMICFWSWLVSKGMFTRIDHKFLVRGHTYLPCDRDFAQIEKRKAAGALIHLPEDWEKIVAEACPSKPFQIQRMKNEDIVDFTPLSKQFTIRKKDSTKVPVLISKASWFNYGEGEDEGKLVSHPGEFWMRSSFSLEQPWQKVCILKGRKKLHPPNQIDLPAAYPNGHPLNPKKVDDLQKMIQYLPPACRDFFSSLANNPILEDDDNEDM